MDPEIYSFALEETINEAMNVCPEISSTFIFGRDKEVIAADSSTSKKSMISVVNAFDGILKKSDVIGGVESITLQSERGRVYIFCINNLYIATVTSEKANAPIVNIVIRVLVPTILKLLDRIYTEPPKSNSHSPRIKDKSNIDSKARNRKIETTPKPLKTQLLVEKLTGLFVSSDTVRIDTSAISQWEKLYVGKEAKKVEIETFNGKTIQCKFKPVKDPKFDGKGIIQMPKKLQSVLEVRKGDLVKVKPVFE